MPGAPFVAFLLLAVAECWGTVVCGTELLRRLHLFGPLDDFNSFLQVSECSFCAVFLQKRWSRPFLLAYLSIVLES